MKIYSHEQKDNLAEAIADTTIAVLQPLVPSKIEVPKLEAMASLSDDDLYDVMCVYVSSGWNLNDDVFDVQELIAAKDTPINKPINNQHISKDVIGHMTTSVVMDRDGNVVGELVPSDLDIVVGGVIYRSWTDAEQKTKVAEIIDEIELGNKCVSMETSFGAFDYAIITPEGEQKFIERNEDSSFLTKYLRAYGGKGEYEGYRIGRLLRKMKFIGKGVVDTPANPRSVFLARSSFKPAKVELFFTSAEVKMDLQKDLDQANAEKDRLGAELASAQSEIDQLKATKAELETSVETVTAELTEVKSQLETAKAGLDEAVSKNTELSNELTKLNKEMVTASRINQLKDKGLTLEKCEEIVAKFDSANDEMFNSVVALIVPEKKDDAETETEAEVTEPDEKVLDEVKEETKAGLTNPAGVENAISFASDFLRTQLRNTPKEK